jgi:hypothetical protein
MKRNRGILFAAVLIIAALGFCTGRLKEASAFQNEYTCVSIRFKTEGVTIEKLKTALETEKRAGEQEFSAITAWNRNNEEEVKNPDLNRKEKLPVLTIAGDMSMTVPMTLKYGNYVYAEDREGCVMDTVTAFALYGTDHAVGNTLICQNKKYYVRGVVKSENPLLLIQEVNTSIRYANLEFDCRNREQAQTFAENFLLQNGFPQDYVIIDGYFYGKIMYSLCNLLLWLFLLMTGVWFLLILWKKKQEIEQRNFFIYLILGLFLLLGYVTILYQLTGSPLYFPEKLLPTKFSDFDYWNRQYRLLMEQLRQARYLLPNEKDVYLENELIKLPRDMIIMLLFYLISIIQMKLALRSKN